VILVDTSIWVDHLRSGSAELSRLLEAGTVLAHPWVIGELALGNLSRRSEVMGLLQGLPQAVVATDHELLSFIDQEALQGTGIGYVDALLLAATRLTRDASLWSGERRLSVVAARLGVSFEPERPTPTGRGQG
jgi:predicted nucleic acid-binding protein